MNRSLLLTVSLALACSVGATPKEPDLPSRENFHLYLLIGQSNMAGRGVLSPTNRVPHDRVYKLDNFGLWTAAKEPLHFDKPVAGAGLGASFANAMLDGERPEVAIGLVPCAFGGTSLDQWRSDDYLFGLAVLRAKKAMRRGTLKGILWHQGEGDCSKELSATYGGRFVKMIATLRRELGCGNVPVVVGELGRYLSDRAAARDVHDWSAVVNAQLNALPSRVPVCACVSSEGLVHKGDGVHFSTESLRVLGRRYAAALKNLAPTERFVDVSAGCPRYFSERGGKTWVPIGINLCYAHPDDSTAADLPEPETMAKLEKWMRAFAANGGNYIRLFLCRPTFEVMPECAGVYDAHNGQNIVKIVRLAEELGIKIKFTLEVFRSVRPANEVSGDWAVKCNKPIYAEAAGGTMEGFFTSETCHDIFMGKVRYLASLGLGDSPAVIDWELFNEIGSGYATTAWVAWSERVQSEMAALFPKQMVTQNLGSFSAPNSYRKYDVLARTEPNGFLQVHRYLDPGAQLRVCRGPMDVLCADAIRELLDRRADKPAVLGETGGVEAGHSGPSKLYDADRAGMLLHDALFAPFFAGGAGTGCFWHWGQQYVDRWNLWYHYARFAKAIDGLDPAQEAFAPFRFETDRLRVFGLRGRKTTVLWCRDRENTWENELVKGVQPREVPPEELPFKMTKTAEWYLPFEDRVVTTAPNDSGFLVTPPMKRACVIRLEVTD